MSFHCSLQLPFLSSLPSPSQTIKNPQHLPTQPIKSNLFSTKPSNLSLTTNPFYNKNSTLSFNSLIRARIESHDFHQALLLFQSILSDSSFLPDNFTFPLVLKACAQLSAVREGKQIHCMVLKSNSIPKDDIFINSSLINMYAQCDRFDEAHLLFDRMPERNTVTWNSMINVFAKSGNMDSARRYFDEMPKRNIISWNTLLGGYVKANLCHDALKLFLELLISGPEPDEATMVSLISVISNLGLLDLGRRAHGSVTRHGFSINGALGVALITMYTKCGCIDAAYKVFSTIVVKNVGHWTSMIGGLATHGLAEAALQVFSEMLSSGVRPNHVTFVGVLSACSHGGLTDEGLKNFGMMRSFGVEPGIQHYGCLVDLLGRGGLIEAAFELLNKLPMDPGFVTWNTLLAACRDHGNVEVAEIAMTKLIELKSDHISCYVLLSNLYAEEGRWEDFRRMREIIEERSVVKVPGFSWIEVDGRVHEFVAGDHFHVKTREIHGILEEMKLNLRLEGYVSMVCTALPSSKGTIHEEDLGIEDSICHTLDMMK